MKKRLTLFVSGKVQRTGYRDRVIDIGKLLNLESYAENLPDGRVRIIAEGEEGNLNRFLDAVDIKNVLINVKDIDHSFSNATGEFYGFKKVVGEGETDERMDIAADLMKQLIGAVKDGFGETISAVKSVKEDTSAMVEKQDRMLEKQVITIDRYFEKCEERYSGDERRYFGNKTKHVSDSCHERRYRSYEKRHLGDEIAYFHNPCYAGRYL